MCPKLDSHMERLTVTIPRQHIHTHTHTYTHTNTYTLSLSLLLSLFLSLSLSHTHTHTLTHTHTQTLNSHKERLPKTSSPLSFHVSRLSRMKHVGTPYFRRCAGCHNTCVWCRNIHTLPGSRIHQKSFAFVTNETRRPTLFSKGCRVSEHVCMMSKYTYIAM